MATPEITSATTGSPTVSGVKTKELTDEFLHLLVAQLKYQDPLKPMDNQDFISELAQLQSLDQQVELAETNQALLLQSSLATGASMIGKLIVGVETTKAGSREIEGVVNSVAVENGETVYMVDTGDGLAHRLQPEDILYVGPTATAPPSAQDQE